MANFGFPGGFRLHSSRYAYALRNPIGPALGALSLSNASVLETIAQGGAVGTVLGTRTGSSLTMPNTAGNRFVLSGGNIVRGSAALDYETATSHQITVRETNAAYPNSPRDTVLTISVANVNEAPSLNALTLSDTSLTQNEPATITILGATAGSVISGSPPDGMTLDSAARTIAGTPAVAGTFGFVLTETLADSANSPRTSNVTVEVVEAVPEPTAQKRIIWDTDLDSDIDDVTATALLLELIHRNPVQLVAATVASTVSTTAPTMRAMLDYGGHSSVPVGAYQGSSITSHSLYTDAVRDAFRPGETRSNYPDAVTVLRQALADAPDGSVRIVVGGTCTNIAELLQSLDDGISPLTGSELVAQKVEHIAVMGGRFNGSTAIENNIAFDPTAADIVASSSPVPVIWAGWEVGGTVFTKYPDAGDTVQDPFAMAWQAGISLTNAEGRRQSWDLVPCYYATEGLGDYYSLSAAHDVSFDGTGSTTKTPNPSGRNFYLVKIGTDAQVQVLFEQIIADFELRCDIYGPQVGFTTMISTAEGAGSTFELVSEGESYTVTLIDGAEHGFSITGTTLNIPAFAYDAAPANNMRDLAVRLTDSEGNTRDVPMTHETLEDAAEPVAVTVMAQRSLFSISSGYSGETIMTDVQFKRGLNIFSVVAGSGAYNTDTSLTMAGISAVKLTESTSGNFSCTFAVVFANDVVGDVVLTYPHSGRGNCCASVVHISGVDPTPTAASTTPWGDKAPVPYDHSSVPLTCPAGGVIVGIGGTSNAINGFIEGEEVAVTGSAYVAKRETDGVIQVDSTERYGGIAVLAFAPEA